MGVQGLVVIYAFKTRDITSNTGKNPIIRLLQNSRYVCKWFVGIYS